jgi:putative ATPase
MMCYNSFMNLAYRLRPTSLDEYVGQEHLVGKGKIIRRMVEQDQLFSMIFWGPPGSGKTTLASIIAKETKSEYHELSGVTAGKADLLAVVRVAEDAKKAKKRTILFIDEIHRWNKAQQDALLPHVESGLITLIGATTENPSFEVISALLSRSRIFILQSLSYEDLSSLIERALKDQEKGLGSAKKSITTDAKDLLIRLSGGDARIMLNALEIAVTNYPSTSLRTSKKHEISVDIIEEIFQTRSAGLYDKKQMNITISSQLL